MSLRPLPAVPEVPGRIWLSSMPGRFESWESFLSMARQAGITEIVCLTPRHEVSTVSPRYAQALEDHTLPFAWSQLPMRNLSVAEAAIGFDAGIAAMAARVRNGASVLLHCAAGIGRTGTAAVCLLKHLGVPGEVALQRVRDAGSHPETTLQSDLISTY